MKTLLLKPLPDEHVAKNPPQPSSFDMSQIAVRQTQMMGAVHYHP